MGEVHQALKLNRSQFNQFDDTTPYTRWDWGLYLVENGKMLPLPTRGKQQLKLVQTERLVRDAVFLVPPGKRRLRLMVDVYVGLRTTSYKPVTVVWVRDDYDLELKAGREITIRPKKVHRNQKGDAFPVPSFG